MKITYRNLDKAHERAKEWSLVYGMMVYLIHSASSGKYVVDSYYEIYSDETLVATYLNGHLQ